MTQISWMTGMVAALNAANMDFGERLSYALRMLAVGLGMVFAVLCLLWLVLAVSRYFLYDLPNKKKTKKNAMAEMVAKASAPLPELPDEKPAAPAATDSVQEEDSVLVAVMTAAISATRSEEGYTGGFRVVSFRRSDKNTAWNRR